MGKKQEKDKYCTVSIEQKKFTASFEDIRLKMYDDDGSASGNATIGIGHLIHRGKINGSEPDEFKKGITKERAIELFEEDVIIREKDLNRWIGFEIKQNHFDAIFDIYWNSGTRPARKLIKLTKEKKYKEGAKYLRNLPASGGVIERRKRLENIYLFNIYAPKYVIFLPEVEIFANE